MCEDLYSYVENYFVNLIFDLKNFARKNKLKIKIEQDKSGKKHLGKHIYPQFANVFISSSKEKLFLREDFCCSSSDLVYEETKDKIKKFSSTLEYLLEKLTLGEEEEIYIFFALTKEDGSRFSYYLTIEKK